jgi:hypothetical protein
MLSLGCPSHQAAPVRRIAVGPVHHRLDPRTRERRHPSRHAREHVLEPIQVGREKTAVEVLRNPIQRPRPGVAFEGSDEERAALPSNVERGVRVPEHGQLRLERSHLVDDLGDQVVVLEGHDREIHPDQLTDLSRPLARGVDHDLCADLALRGLEPPSTAVALDRRHGGVPEDPSSLGGRSLCERLRQPGRIDVAVARRMRGPDDALRVDERKELADPLGSDDLEGNTQLVRDALAVLVLVEPVLRPGEPHAPATMQVDRLTRLGLERFVQIEAVPEQLHQVVARNHLCAETRRVPGGAAGELVLLEEQDVAPSELRQVIEEAAARHASADDDDPRFAPHCSPPRTRGLLSSAALAPKPEPRRLVFGLAGRCDDQREQRHHARQSAPALPFAKPVHDSWTSVI